jgi:hypothetical protein
MLPFILTQFSLWCLTTFPILTAFFGEAAQIRLFWTPY